MLLRTFLTGSALYRRQGDHRVHRIRNESQIGRPALASGAPVIPLGNRDPATLGIVTFQHRLPNLSKDEIHQLNEAMTAEICRTGHAYMSTSLVDGRKVQRLCLDRHDATEEDVLQTVGRLEAIAAELTANR